MRKITVSVLLAMLLVSATLPAHGQKPVCFYNARGEKVVVPSRSASTQTADRLKKSLPDLQLPKEETATFAKVEAISDGDGALVKWQMESEKNNLGFYVYRSNGGEKELVNEVMMTGSAAITARIPVYGQQYSLFDRLGGIDTMYFIQAVGPEGERTITDPVPSVYSPDIPDADKVDRTAVKEGVNDLQSTYPVVPKLQRSLITAETADLSLHRWVVNQAGAKIAVKVDGLYRVRISELQSGAPGIFTTGNTRNWRLFREGVEQAVLIGTDATGTYMDFFGRSIDTRESGTRIYYLIADPATPGLRMGRPRQTERTGTTSISYAATVEKKERTTYLGTISNGEPENWWGRPITYSANPTTSPGARINITLTGIDYTQPNSVINVKLQGWSLTGFLPRVSVRLNGTYLGEISAGSSQIPFSSQFSVPTSILVEGSNNRLDLTSEAGFDDNTQDPPVHYHPNSELFDSVTVSYARKYQATSNRLAFFAPSQQTADLTGFTSDKIRVFNIQSDDKPFLIGHVDIDPVGVAPDVTYKVRWPSLSRYAGQKTYAVEESGIMSSPSITRNNPSNLSATTRLADMIIISAPQFMSNANTWAAYRASQGVSVAVVDVTDIMDEYNYGSNSSAAIRDFLQYVKNNWSTQIPDKQYVLLIGDATRDPKDYLGYAALLGSTSFDQVPTMTVNVLGEEVGSDEALGDFNGDGLAEMAIGRIPFRDASWITTAYNKTVFFESNASLRSPTRGILFAHDLTDSTYDFFSMSQELGVELAPSIPRNYIGRGAPNAHAALVSGINAGPYLVNYSGHGAQSLWGVGAFMDNVAIRNELTNSANPSIVTMLTCLTGFFTGDNKVIGATIPDESMAELFIKSPLGGGPAAWASSGTTDGFTQIIMGRRFFNSMNAGNIPRMGDLIRDAKSSIAGHQEVTQSWVLFGDPMLRVR